MPRVVGCFYGGSLRSYLMGLLGEPEDLGFMLIWRRGTGLIAISPKALVDYTLEQRS